MKQETEIKQFLDRLNLSLEFDDSIEANSVEELINKGNEALDNYLNETEI